MSELKMHLPPTDSNANLNPPIPENKSMNVNSFYSLFLTEGIEKSLKFDCISDLFVDILSLY